MQEKTWYYEKWVGRHASFPPSRYVKQKLKHDENKDDVFLRKAIPQTESEAYLAIKNYNSNKAGLICVKLFSFTCCFGIHVGMYLGNILQ